jgi:hypothetical protein
MLRSGQGKFNINCFIAVWVIFAVIEPLCPISRILVKIKIFGISSSVSLVIISIKEKFIDGSTNRTGKARKNQEKG